MTNSVPVGIASRVGYLLTLLGGAATAWAAASTHPAISAEVLLIVTIAAGVLTNLGRQMQAPKITPETVDQVPPALVGIAPTAQVPADGVDSAAVPFAQPSSEQPAQS